MPALDLSYIGIAEASAAFRSKELSPVELTRTMLDRIDRLDPKLNAYLTPTPEQALSQARAAEDAFQRGDATSPLLGIPMAYKDIFQTRGVRTTGGSALLADWVPDEDSTCVAKLTEAGAVMLGKVITHEFAFGLQTPGHRFLPARNPWNTDHVPGGSSSGSGAALAAGLCLGALGSDTGGSIRGPASFCGITGLKPTFGRVSKYGVLPLAWSLDHAGPMARSAEDCALMLQTLAGHDPKDPTCAMEPVGDYLSHLKDGVKDLRVGVLVNPEGWDPDPPVVSALAEAVRAFSSLGASIADVTIPSFALSQVNTLVMLAEAYAYHAADLARAPELYGEQLRGRLLAGGLITGAEYVQGQRLRSRLRAEMAAALEQVDVLLMPVTQTTASTMEDGFKGVTLRSYSWMGALNLCGLPALALPSGFDEKGLPVGMQLAGRPFDEATVLRAGHAYQQATDWHKRHPALAS
jgi:aspartyl-tRNA(Asn)/glutamyl-tRNA(Gln) amidotransferase subunit A